MNDTTAIVGSLYYAISKANYRRRVRRIDMSDVAQALREARRSGIGYVSGGTVANAYKYPASTAAVAAVRIPGGYYVRAGSHDARRGSSQVTWFGPDSCRERHLRGWREQQTRETLLAGGWIALTPREVVGILRKRVATITGAPGVTVTIEDSLAAGNCPHETRRVAEALAVDRISAPRLAQWIARHEPSLVRYAQRAIDYAERRAAARRLAE
jgi:hypothetical protein